MRIRIDIFYCEFLVINNVCVVCTLQITPTNTRHDIRLQKNVPNVVWLYSQGQAFWPWYVMPTTPKVVKAGSNTFWNSILLWLCPSWTTYFAITEDDSTHPAYRPPIWNDKCVTCAQWGSWYLLAILGGWGGRLIITSYHVEPHLILHCAKILNVPNCKSIMVASE